MARVNTQDEANLVIPLMGDIPAKIRGISFEPLLERVDLSSDLSHINWAILGGESGKGARPFDIAWLPEMHRQLTAAGVEWFMKQAGENPIDSRLADHQLSRYQIGDKKGEKCLVIPEVYRGRFFPK